MLFLCTHNSDRSQMAEGFLNTMYGGRFEAQSARIILTQINPYFIKAMAEIGSTSQKNGSKNIEIFRGLKLQLRCNSL